MLSIYYPFKRFSIPDIVSRVSFCQVGKKIVLFEGNEPFRAVARAFRYLQVDVFGVAFEKPELLHGQKLNLKIPFCKVYY